MCFFFSAKSFSTATKLSHITCFSWRATLDILVVFSVWGRLPSLTSPGRPKKSCRFLVDSFDCVLSQKPLFSPHQTVKACLHKRRDAAPSAASRGNSLGRCLKVNTVNSIYSSSAPLFFVLSPTQPPKPLHPFLPLFPLSLTPTSFNLFHPFFFSLRILPALFSSSPLSTRHPSPRPRLSGKVIIAGFWSGRLYFSPSSCLLAVITLWNQSMVCVRTRFCISQGVCACSHRSCFQRNDSSAPRGRKTITRCVCINLEIAQIENRNYACWKENYHISRKINVFTLAWGGISADWRSIFLKTAMETFFSAFTGHMIRLPVGIGSLGSKLSKSFWIHRCS